MADILEPAITYGREGFPVSEVIAFEMATNYENKVDYPGFAETYLPNGRPPMKGEVFVNADLANTYELIVEQGRDVFYKGEIARTIDTYMKNNGGFLAYEDLAAHEGEWVEPISTNYRGYDVWELPPNGQGTASSRLHIGPLAAHCLPWPDRFH